MLASQRSNIIFLISQPRAGSTLTQRMLGGHADIFTLSEPWLMLHPLYALRESGFLADYETKPARAGVMSFLEYISPNDHKNSKQLYFESIASVYGDLYQKAVSASGKSIFLDKTPRYYNIIPELYSTFPQAKFIILVRNPLAVLCSMISTWTQSHWFGLRRFKHDLIQAPDLLIKGIETLGEKAIVLHYEELVSDPETAIANLCRDLDISYSSELIDYGNVDTPPWAMGDKKSIHKKKKPDASNADRWIDSLQSAQIWRFANDYLKELGPERIERLGYNYNDLRTTLDKNHPSGIRLLNSLSLTSVLKEYEDFACWNYGYYPTLIKYSFQNRGILKTAARAIQKILPF